MRTEHDFTLPVGYLAEDGTIAKTGTMRLATAADELLPLKDPRVRQNEAYLAVILLSRVVTRLGPLDVINPKVIESLFAADFAFLQSLYSRLNTIDAGPLTCPKCGEPVEVADHAAMGEP